MTKSETVWLLFQLRRDVERETNVILGAFSTESAALDAGRLLPDEEGVAVDVIEYDLDDPAWLEGFATEWPT